MTVVYSCSDLLSQIKRLAFLAQGGKGGTGHIFVGETHHRPLAPPSAVSVLQPSTCRFAGHAVPRS